MERRLTTILAADIAEFSRLVGADEEGTLATQRAYRAELVDPLLEAHGGRIANTAGDSVLVEFPSTVEAVRMAMAVQAGMAERNADVPPDRRIEYRIGINVGDVVAEGEDLLGDGVNIAARLETLAPPGGIVLSHTVHDQIGNKFELDLADLGEVEVKNIAQPIHAFQVLREGEAPITPARPSQNRRAILAGTLFGLVAVLASALWFGVMSGQDGEIAWQAEPAVASVAILPFEPLATDREQELFAKGLTEDISTALSRVPGLLVISQNSMEQYRGQKVDPRDVANEVGVDNLLTGSVQRSGEQLRVSMQLTKGEDGTNLWSRRYDRKLEDVFALQDEIVKEVLVELQVNLTVGEAARFLSRGTRNLEAWLLNLRGIEETFKFTMADNMTGRKLYEAAITADPDWASPIGGLAWTYREAVRRGWSKDVEADRTRGIELARRAIEMDPDDPIGYNILGNLYIESGRFEEGITLREKAVEVAPNSFYPLAGLAWQLPFVNQEKRALTLYERAERISPLKPGWFVASKAFALHVDGQHDRAIKEFQEALSLMDFPILHGRLAAVYAEIGQMDEAYQQVQLLLEKKPDIRVDDLMQVIKFRDQERLDWYRGTLVKAGIPE